MIAARHQKTPCWVFSVKMLRKTGAKSRMSYTVDSAMGSPVPYSAPRPAMARQGPVNTFEDPRMTYTFQMNYHHQQRLYYPFWDEMATQEVPTGLEHCGSGMNEQRFQGFLHLSETGKLTGGAVGEWSTPPYSSLHWNVVTTR
ncbi:transforming protein p68/c-ets-1-like [Dipodomys spectabilis]|uniref:transforming protein p68/c-ets-1-like n=1 Tax=Dipodomys spectabilis TaxID=105255 RepID=UPI001C545E54|nr:transforming protein p68/c-ets-1-like [Dipodomys spectabilis]